MCSQYSNGSHFPVWLTLKQTYYILDALPVTEQCHTQHTCSKNQQNKTTQFSGTGFRTI